MTMIYSIHEALVVDSRDFPFYWETMRFDHQDSIDHCQQDQKVLSIPTPP